MLLTLPDRIISLSRATYSYLVLLGTASVCIGFHHIVFRCIYTQGPNSSVSEHDRSFCGVFTASNRFAAHRFPMHLYTGVLITMHRIPRPRPAVCSLFRHTSAVHRLYRPVDNKPRLRATVKSSGSGTVTSSATATSFCWVLFQHASVFITSFSDASMHRRPDNNASDPETSAGGMFAVSSHQCSAYS